MLCGCHPSIGRACVEAYGRFGDVYRRFREPLKRLGAAGWEPITLASAGPEARVERFGNAARGLYFTAFNPSDEAKAVRLEIDAAALGLPRDYAVTDMLTGQSIGTRPVPLTLAAGDVTVVGVDTVKRRQE